MLHIITKRLRRTGGFTLAESMMAILILLMATAVVVAAIPAAQRAYTKVTDSANAQVLLSTTVTRLRDELDTAVIKASDVDIANDTITYSLADGSKNTIYSYKSVTEDDEVGIYVYREYVSKSFKYQLVSELTGGKGMYMTFDLDSYSGGLLTFKNLEVRKGDNTLATLDELKIRVLPAS